MRKILILFICCFSLQIQAQEASLAFLYLRNGEYEKAAAIYKTLHEKNPLNSNYLTNLVDCYQQLENFNEVQSIINKQLEKRSDQYYLLVELGYNYQLQYKQDSATFYYEKALNSIEKSKNQGYLIGRSFQKNHLLDYALSAFKKSMEANPNANFNLQIAAIYGEKAELEKFSDKKHKHIASVRRLTNLLYKNCSRVEKSNSNGKDFLPILRSELKKFKKLQSTWMLTL